MSRTNKTCLVISLKFITFTSFILGAVLIITCGWTIAPVLKTLHDKNGKDVEKLVTPATIQIQNNRLAKLEFEPGNQTTDSNSPENDDKYKPVFPKIEYVVGTYRLMVLACLSSAILAGFLQMITSMFTLSSCSKKINGGIKTWVSLHTFVFLILLVCLAVPLTYHPQRGEHLKAKELIPSVRSRLLELFGQESLVKALTHDLTAYYVVLALNEVLLLVFVLGLCTCMLCGKGHSNYEPIR